MSSSKRNFIPHLLIAIILVILWLINWLTLAALIAVLIMNFVAYWAIQKAKANRKDSEQHFRENASEENEH